MFWHDVQARGAHCIFAYMSLVMIGSWVVGEFGTEWSYKAHHRRKTCQFVSKLGEKPFAAQIYKSCR